MDKGVRGKDGMGAQDYVTSCMWVKGVFSMTSGICSVNTAWKSRVLCAKAGLSQDQPCSSCRVVFLVPVPWAGPGDHCSVCAVHAGRGLSQCPWAC